MKIKSKYYITGSLLLLIACSLTGLTSCEKYLEDTKLPSGTIADKDAFVSDNSVSAIVTGILMGFNNGGGFSGSSNENVAYVSGLYTDELMPLPNTSVNTTNALFYADGITSSNAGQWSDMYSRIYEVNAALEGIEGTSATLYNKDQWMGECYFYRALLYYYLVNLYGDVPLALTTDYTANGSLSRAPQADVYQQIITDLKKAQDLLTEDYKDGYGSATSGRTRPNKAAATALMAKAYLYTQEWANAEAAATAVIDSSAYQLESMDKVFLSDSRETIWALAANSGQKTYEYGFYNGGMPAATTTDPANFLVLVSMSDFLRNAFEAGDLRYTDWVRSTIYTPGSGSPDTFYFPDKYKSVSNGAEHTVFLRLADMYLVRAEARAHQNNITGANSAGSDLDRVRARAGLPGTTATTQADMLTAIFKERQVELFTECSNRFFDLKRSGTIDEVMNGVAPQKGGTWSSFKQLWPISPTEVQLNPHLTLNPGY